MKNLSNLRYWSACLTVISALVLQACSDGDSYDVEGTTVNKVYINTQSWNPINTPKNSVLFDVTNTPVGSIVGNSNQLEMKLAVKCTHEARNNIYVQFQVDNSLIQEGFAELPGDINLNMNTNELTIGEGATGSNDSIAISISSVDLEKLPVGEYMAPIRISSVTNALSSDNLSTAYLIIKTTESNCYKSPAEDDMVGIMVEDRSQWTAALSIPTSFGSMENMFDGNTRSYWFVNPAQVCDLTVNLGAQHMGITGLQIHTYSRNYSLTYAEVYTSADGQNWTSNGIAELATGYSSQYIKFYAPVSAQFFKLAIKEWSSSFLVISEFNIYKEE